MLIKRCNDVTLHDFENLESGTKCKWCGKTIKEISKEATNSHDA